MQHTKGEEETRDMEGTQVMEEAWNQAGAMDRMVNAADRARVALA